MADGRANLPTFNPRTLSRGTLIPEGVIMDATLPPGAKLCYGQLRRHVLPSGGCRCSEGRLARELAVSGRQVRRYLRALERGGWIAVETTPGKVHTFLFLLHPVFAKSSLATADISVRTVRTHTSGEYGHGRPDNKGLSRGVLEGENVRRRQEQYTGVEAKLQNPYDDDDKTTWRKGLLNGERTSYLSSSQQELRLLCAMRFQEEPDLNLIFSITTLVEQRGWTLPAYIQHLKPRLERCKRPPGPGLLIKVAEGLPLRSKPRPPGYREPGDKTPRIEPADCCPRCHCRKGKGLVESEGRVIPCPECNSAAASP